MGRDIKADGGDIEIAGGVEAEGVVWRGQGQCSDGLGVLEADQGGVGRN